MLALFVGIAVFAQPQTSLSQEPEQSALDAQLMGLELDHFDRLDGRTLFGAHQPLLPDSSPDELLQELFERDASGKLTLIASGVVFAAYAPDGAVLYVQNERLLEVKVGGSEEPKLIAQPVLGDFTIDSSGKRLAVARPDTDMDSWIELIDRSGRHLAVVTEPDGANAWPQFSEDGESVYFMSSRTGVYSLFSFREGGGEVRQVTNRGLEPGADVLGPRFVPPPAVRSSIRKIDRKTISYSDSEATWQVDMETGAARSSDGRVR